MIVTRTPSNLELLYKLLDTLNFEIVSELIDEFERNDLIDGICKN
jgi:hypothetical protein